MTPIRNENVEEPLYSEEHIRQMEKWVESEEFRWLREKAKTPVIISAEEWARCMNKIPPWQRVFVESIPEPNFIMFGRVFILRG